MKETTNCDWYKLTLTWWKIPSQTDWFFKMCINIISDWWITTNHLSFLASHFSRIDWLHCSLITMSVFRANGEKLLHFYPRESYFCIRNFLREAFSQRHKTYQITGKKFLTQKLLTFLERKFILSGSTRLGKPYK